MFNHRTMESLHRERNRLNREFGGIERGDIECIRRVYEWMLARYCLVDIEIRYRQLTGQDGEMPGNSSLPEVGRTDK